MPEILHLVDVIDPHVHWRSGPMARLVAPHSSLYCTAALPMPNEPRLNTPEKVLDNTAELRTIVAEAGHACAIIKCMMLDQVDVPTTPTMIDQAVNKGIRTFKIYFLGTTTGSMGENPAGITDLHALEPALRQIELRGGILLVHFELPAPHYFQWRERDSVPLLYWLANTFPKLKIVAEHITTARMVRAVMELGANVSATITPHHLYDTLDAVNGGFLNPHAHCKPPHADPDNQVALCLAATSGNPKFRLGSDTAPHDQSKKECAEGCAGCFTAPLVLPMLAEVFTRLLPAELVERRLQTFISHSAAGWYGVELLGKRVTLVRKRWKSPKSYALDDGRKLIPYRAGHEWQWTVTV